MKRVVGLIVLLVVGFSIGEFASAARRGLEYDELWTWEHYARAESVGIIFSDLTTPNNHPLHSLLVRWSVGLWGEGELAVRLPALAAGVLLLALLPVVLWTLTQDAVVAALTTMLCVLNAPLLHFLQTARGYGLQTLSVMLCVSFLWWSRRDSRWLVGAVLAGIAGALTLPTTILFIAPVIVVDLVLRRRERVVWIAHGILGVVVGPDRAAAATSQARARQPRPRLPRHASR